MPKSYKNRKIENEKSTVKAMIGLFCRNRHDSGNILCPDCAALAEYSFLKLNRCPFGEKKPSCSKCTIHCYDVSNRKKIREVMRYSGPKLLFSNPVLAARHMFNKLRAKS